MLLAVSCVTRVCDGHGTVNGFVITGVERSMNPMRDIQIRCTIESKK